MVRVLRQSWCDTLTMSFEELELLAAISQAIVDKQNDELSKVEGKNK